MINTFQSLESKGFLFLLSFLLYSLKFIYDPIFSNLEREHLKMSRRIRHDYFSVGR